jgi:AcrR family transcriptional regulator
VRGFSSVTIRQIAAAAGSSPAMIHYYFGDKLGLYRAMLDEAFRPVASAFQRSRDPSSSPAPGIASLVRVYMNMLAANPWVPALIVQEVLAQGGQFRRQFIEHFAAHLAPLFVEALRREQAQGAVRADVDPRLAAVSAVSLSVFPFLALPVTSRVFGLSTGGDALERLTAHTTRVLLEGIGASETAR